MIYIYIYIHIYRKFFSLTAPSSFALGLTDDPVQERGRYSPSSSVVKRLWGVFVWGLGVNPV